MGSGFGLSLKKGHSLPPSPHTTVQRAGAVALFMGGGGTFHGGGTSMEGAFHGRGSISLGGFDSGPYLVEGWQGEWHPGGGGLLNQRSCCWQNHWSSNTTWRLFQRQRSNESIMTKNFMSGFSSLAKHYKSDKPGVSMACGAATSRSK